VRVIVLGSRHGEAEGGDVLRWTATKAELVGDSRLWVVRLQVKSWARLLACYPRFGVYCLYSILAESCCML
jgi:hypothetical protein